MEAFLYIVKNGMSLAKSVTYISWKLFYIVKNGTYLAKCVTYISWKLFYIVKNGTYLAKCVIYIARKRFCIANINTYLAKKLKHATKSNTTKFMEEGEQLKKRTPQNFTLLNKMTQQSHKVKGNVTKQ